MRFTTAYTPRHWEIGIAFFLGHWYDNKLIFKRAYKPTAIDLYFGPWSLEITFGSEIVVQPPGGFKTTIEEFYE